MRLVTDNWNEVVDLVKNINFDHLYKEMIFKPRYTHFDIKIGSIIEDGKLKFYFET